MVVKTAITGDEVREVCHGTPYLQVEAGVASGCDSRYLAAMNEMTPLARPPRARKPDWIRVKAPTSAGFAETKRLMREKNLTTVCEEAACPNIGECWTKKHATVMIRSEEHPSELQSLMRRSYAVFCLKKKKKKKL